MKLAAAYLAVGLAAAQPAFAHHSFAAYEDVKTETLSGTLEAFQWANPHAMLQVLVQDQGKPETWSIVTSGPEVLKSFGWTKDSLKPGDRVTILINPMRDGSTKGRLHTVTVLGTGQVLKTKLSDPATKP